jgi:uncharacterized protein (DUF58 family)
MKPAGPLVGAAAAWAALAAACVLAPALSNAWLGFGALLALVAGVDFARARRRTPLKVERAAPHMLSLGAWTAIELRLENPGARAERVEVWDGCPPQTEFEGQPCTLELPANSAGRIEYRLRALRRGSAPFGPVEVLRGSPWRLWTARERTSAPQSLRVYPNFTAIAGFELNALERRIALLGIRRTRRRGEGFEFRQLRDYVAGDALRQIDWRATSRRRKPIAREHQEERDQELVFVLDCGRRMRAMDGDLAHFDHALNALLLVAYIALRQGDAVSLLTFGGSTRSLAPVKGRGAITTLLNAVYDLETTLEASDFLEAAMRVKARHPRRALVVLLTNQRDDDEEELRPALELLRKQHVVVVASLRERAVELLAEAAPDDVDAAARLCAAQSYLDARQATLERVRGRGVTTLDCAPSRLHVELAQKYLEIKRAGSL